jgi:Predicted hydrolase (HAD superfamily)
MIGRFIRSRPLPEPGTVRAVSFDVFDTCLTRDCIRPGDLFFTLAKTALTRRHGRADDNAVHELAHYRIEFEREARRHLPPGTDVSIERLYETFAPERAFGIPAHDMMAAELELEAKHLRPVPAMRDYIGRLRNAGTRVLFISDMYLPGGFIRDQLVRHGLAVATDPVYLSSDTGQTKHSGELFRTALGREGLRPRELVHVGDNPWSDIRQARRCGIRPVLFDAVSPTRAEAELMHEPLGICPVRSRMAGAARLARLHDDTPDILTDIAATIVAPLLCAFTASVMHRAVRDGVDTLHFVSRDGHILHEIARRLDIGNIKANYLHGSRQAWFLPSTDAEGDEWLEWALVQGHSTKGTDILRRLHLSPKELCDAADGACLAPDQLETVLDAGQVQTLVNALRQPPVRTLIARKAAEQRKAFLRYLDRHTVDTDAPVHIVDVGWTLKGQRALQRIFDMSGIGAEVHGHYLGVVSSRCSHGIEGRYTAMFTETDRGLTRDEPANPLIRNANIIEQVFLGSPQQRVAGYSDTGDVLLSPDHRSSDHLTLIRRVHAVVLAYAESLSDVLADESTLARQSDAARARLERFLTAPTRDEARAVGGFLVGDDQNESRTRPLARPVSPRLLAQWLRSEHLAGPRPDYADSFDWIEGSVAMSHRLLRPLLRRRAAFEMMRTLRKSL